MKKLLIGLTAALAVVCAAMAIAPPVDVVQQQQNSLVTVDQLALAPPESIEALAFTAEKMTTSTASDLDTQFVILIEAPPVTTAAAIKIAINTNGESGMSATWAKKTETGAVALEGGAPEGAELAAGVALNGALEWAASTLGGGALPGNCLAESLVHGIAINSSAGVASASS